MAGGALRKRALQTLAVTALLAGCATLWIAHVSPHWPREMQSNFAFTSAKGSINDPGPFGMAARGVINLQSALSFFRDDPHFYNPVSYLICGILIFLWGLKTLRCHFSIEGASLAFAAIAALSLLPVYHRSYDAMLLLLSLPACALLWKVPGPKRWIALGLTSAAILLTASTPSVFLYQNARTLAAFASRLPGRLPTVFVLRPTPFVLLAVGCFYLWLYLRYQPALAEQVADAAVSLTDLQSPQQQTPMKLEPKSNAP